jgi:segregation and condensation protein B
VSDAESIPGDQPEPEAAAPPPEAVATPPEAGVPPTLPLGLAATIESLLFLSSEPVSASQLADACGVEVGAVGDVLDEFEQTCMNEPRGIVLRRVSGGFALASAPGADEAARRLFAKPRTPPLTQAQAECLATIAYLQPISRPEVARIRGVNSESALGTLLERGLIQEAGRTKLGAVIYRTTELFERLFGLDGLDALPDVRAFDPSPEDERELRERLLKAGEARAAGQIAQD